MPRALLTDAEREALDPDSDMDQNNRTTYLSRVKNRIELLEEDARLLREHRPDLYAQVHEAVCEEAIDERIERLEDEVAALQERADDT